MTVGLEQEPDMVLIHLSPTQRQEMPRDVADGFLELFERGTDVEASWLMGWDVDAWREAHPCVCEALCVCEAGA